MLIVGAPVANRAWSLPRWFSCLAEQTVRPDGFVFVHSGIEGDATWQAIERETARHGFQVEILHDPAPPIPRHDNARFALLATLRNRLLRAVAERHASLFLSLDTDIMLENPRTIERLAWLVADGAGDIAQPVTFFHPYAPRAWQPGQEVCGAYNAGWLPVVSDADDKRRPWTRPHPCDLPWGEILRIDIPMGCWLGNRRVLACRYLPHESGEDIGFGMSLQAAGLTAVVDTNLYVPHIWSEQDSLTETWA